MTRSPLIVTTESTEWLTNSYLVADRPGGRGVIVDSNGVLAPLLDAAREHDVTIEKLVLTHHHWDHVVSHAEDAEAAGGVPVVAAAETATLVEGVDETYADGDVLRVGDLRIEARHTPGHCSDHHALVVTVEGQDGPPTLFSADVLFKGTVGGTFNGGPTGFAQLRTAITERFADLPDDTDVRPGHREPTTLGAERSDNPFLRVWSGVDPEGDEPVTIVDLREDLDGPATLVLWAPDYDGGNKAWVRYADGRDVIVGGSRVKRD
ncbi:MAG: hypothetical protein M0P31_02070 [Solirubrobacteraceae bacterium]|nr:hypothetical protein [Solirubrobacteraceae bacterium]